MRLVGVILCYVLAFLCAMRGGSASTAAGAWIWCLAGVVFLVIGTLLGGWRVLFRGR